MSSNENEITEDLEMHPTDTCEDEEAELDNPILPGPESGITKHTENTREKIKVDNEVCD